SELRDGPAFNLSNDLPMLIGFGAQNYFSGALSDVRLYEGALDADSLAKIAKDTPAVNAHRMFRGALVADSFDGPTLDTQTWHRPDWLVENDPNLSVSIQGGRLRIAGVSRPKGGDHQYTGLLSTYFRQTHLILTPPLRTA